MPGNSEKLCVALDVPSVVDAGVLIIRLAGLVGWFKVGSQLFTATGPAIFPAVKKAGCKLFLDLKWYDIPNTVANAVTAATLHGVDMVTLHGRGGREMLKAARRAADETSQKHGIPTPKLIAVTVLTHLWERLDSEDMHDHYGSAKSQLLQCWYAARTAGMDGLVCPPAAINFLRDRIPPDWLLVVPGVRASNVAQITEEGADVIVVGRPIIEAPCPLTAAKFMADTINHSRKELP